MTKKGYVFVIPNHVNFALTPEETKDGNVSRWSFDIHQRIWDELKDSVTEPVKMLETTIENSEYRFPREWVQVWWADIPETRIGEISDKGSSNWRSHGLYLDDGTYIKYALAEYVPAAMFDGKKEGDVVNFTFEGVDYEVELAQSKGRYAKFGKFEDVFEEHVLRYSPEAVVV
jgi:hypothetical protein